jgi:1,4-dihydroxy-2-naphthoate octaprenyltransferase
VLVVVYLVVHRFLNYLKEFLVAVLYTGGVLIPALTRTASPLQFLLSPECFIFLIAALLNLLLFSWYEMKQDKVDGHPSFANYFGEQFTKKVMVILFMAQGLLLVYLLSTHFGKESIILFAMNAVLALLIIFPNVFRQLERYRLVGDAIFLFPGLVLFL